MDQTKSVRVTYTFSGVLISHASVEPVDATALGADIIARDSSGSWIEVRNAADQVLYQRRDRHSLAGIVGLYAPTPQGTDHQPLALRDHSGTDSLLIPQLEGAVALVFFGPSRNSTGLPILNSRAVELARLALV